MGLGILSLAAKILASIHSTSSAASHQWNSESGSGILMGNMKWTMTLEWQINLQVGRLDPVVKNFAVIHATSSPEQIVSTFQNW